MSPDEREIDRRIYGVDRDALARAGPSVVSVNGVVASLGVTEFMAHVTGLREPVRQLTYRADLGMVTKLLDPPQGECYYCVRGGVSQTTIRSTAMRKEPGRAPSLFGRAERPGCVFKLIERYL
jgi:hypothetical protein